MVFLSALYALSGETRRTCLQLVGCASFLYGVDLIYRPAWFILGGLGLAAILEIRR